MANKVRFKSPVVPNAPTEYNQSLFQRTFSVLRIYFNQIDEHLRRDLGDTTISGTCDITGNTTVGGTLDVTGTTTLNGATTINNDIEIKGTDAGSTGPEIDFYHLSASPADSDRAGVINFFGNNDADEKVLFGKIEGLSTDVSNGTERGQLNFTKNY